MGGKPRYDYIGVANGGKEIGPEPGLIDQADYATDGLLKKGFNAGLGNMGRAITQPGNVLKDALGYWGNKAAGAVNSALGATTGYKIPGGGPNFDYGRTMRTAEEMQNANSEFMGGLADRGYLQKVPGSPASQPRQAIPGPRGGMTPLKMGPGDLSKLSNGQVPMPRRPSEGMDQYLAKNGFSGSASMSGRFPSSQQAMPAAPPQAQLGTFQVEGGRKRSFSADASGAWYEGGKRMGGIYDAAGPNGPGAGAGGNAEVNAIVNRLLSQQPQAQGGVDRRGLPMGQTMDEYVNQNVNQRGWDAGAAAQMYYRSALPASTQNFSAQQGADYQRGMLGNHTAKTQLDALMTPTEMAQRGAMTDYYKAHAGQLRTMSDPNFLLRMKGKDAETERMKMQGDLTKTLLPKAYETATELTKRALENNPGADANDLFNRYFSNSMAAYQDKFSQGKRYSQGVAIPGKESWFGYNSPEVNIPGSWEDPDMAELNSDVAGALAATDDGLKHTKIMNEYYKYKQAQGLRGRSQGIPAQ